MCETHGTVKNTSRNWQGSFRKTPGRLLGLVFIRFYQLTFSSLIGHSCRHLPTCSEYGYEAIARHGFWSGGFLTLFRVGRCFCLTAKPFWRGPASGLHTNARRFSSAVMAMVLCLFTAPARLRIAALPMRGRSPVSLLRLIIWKRKMPPPAICYLSQWTRLFSLPTSQNNCWQLVLQLTKSCSQNRQAGFILSSRFGHWRLGRRWKSGFSTVQTGV